MRAGLRLTTLLIVPLLLANCVRKAPEVPIVPPVLPTVTGLVLRGGGEDLVTVTGNAVSGELYVIAEEETHQVTVHFIDDDEVEFTPATGFAFGLVLNDTGIASLADKSGWSFRLLGVSDGMTSLDLAISYEGEVKYAAPAIPVRVERILSPFLWLAPDSLQTLVTATPLVIEVEALPDDPVTRVQFSVNGDFLAWDSNAPYTIDWDPLGGAAPGIYGLEARGFSADGTPLAADTLYVMVPELSGDLAGSFGGGGDDRVYDMTVLADGSVIMAGETTMPDGYMDGCLIKVTPGGGERWFRAYGGSAGDHLRALRPTADGGFIACGWTWREPDARRGPNFWLLKLDAVGGVEWSRVHGDSDAFQYAHSLRPTADGGYIVAGSDASGTSLVLLKTDSAGDEEWFSSFAGAPSAGGFDVLVSPTGYVLTGYRQPAGENAQLCVIRTNAGGSAIWERVYTLGGSSDQGRALLARTDGYAVLGGGGGDVWFLGLDTNGDEDWSRVFGDSGLDRGEALIATSDGGFLLTGFTTADGIAEPSLWVAKTDADGNAQWSNSFGRPGADSGQALAEIDGGYLVAGVTEGGATGGFDIWLIELDADGNLVD